MDGELEEEQGATKGERMDGELEEEQGATKGERMDGELKEEQDATKGERMDGELEEEQGATKGERMDGELEEDRVHTGRADGRRTGGRAYCRNCYTFVLSVSNHKSICLFFYISCALGGTVYFTNS